MRNKENYKALRQFLKKRNVILESTPLSLFSLPERLQYVSFRCEICKAIEKDVCVSNLKRRKGKSICQNCKNRFDYSLPNIIQVIESAGGKYISAKVKKCDRRNSLIKYICPCREPVEKRAQDAKRTPGGCGACRGKKISESQRQWNLELCQQMAQERGGRCLSTNEPKSADSKLTWQCSLRHASWRASISSIKHQGTWCSTCGSGRRERTIRALLEAAFETSFPSTYPDYLHGLELDCTSIKLGFAVEVQSRFHLRSEQKKRDKKKKELCKGNIQLLEFWPRSENDSLEKLRENLATLLEFNNIKPLNNVRTVAVDLTDIYDVAKNPAFQKFSLIVEDKGATFNSGEWMGVSKNINVQVHPGDKPWNASPASVNKGRWCPCKKCANNAKKDVSDIKKELAKKGWKLGPIVTYKNAHHNLNFICPNGHPVSRSWNKLISKKYSCKECRLAIDRSNNLNLFKSRMEARSLQIEKIHSDTWQGQNNTIVTARHAACGDRDTILAILWLSRKKCAGCNEYFSS